MPSSRSNSYYNNASCVNSMTRSAVSASDGPGYPVDFGYMIYRAVFTCLQSVAAPGGFLRFLETAHDFNSTLG